jgi:hypothetical protein
MTYTEDCTSCKKGMSDIHRCYDDIPEKNTHTLEGKPICHQCWDKDLEQAVQAAGY